jgi:hypothetical protein
MTYFKKIADKECNICGNSAALRYENVTKSKLLFLLSMKGHLLYGENSCKYVGDFRR